jgi:DNA polymerase I-like protein with 3'-5' exonuclease and polymerase domains
VKVYFDIETDGLDATKVHCICAMQDHEDTMYNFIGKNPYLDFSSWLKSEKIDTLVAHNGIGFDLPVLERLSGEAWDYTIRDTLVLSRLSNPSLEGGHSLRNWGVLLDNYKGDYTGGWEQYSTEMLKYCQQDVRLLKDVYKRLMIQLKDFNEQSIELEHKVAEIIHHQQQNGVEFNERKGYELLAELKEKVHSIVLEVREVFTPLAVWKELTVLQKPYNKDRTPSKAYQRQLDRGAHHRDGEWGCIEYPEFNLGSRQQVARYLQHFGWSPTERTEKGSIIVNEKVLADVDIPEAKMILDYFTISKRVAMVKAWLEAVGTDGRIHGRVNSCGAITGRMTHSNPNLAQVPASYSPYGEECRELWTVPEGKKLVGIDASGLELRMLAHYMNDDDYTEEILNGDIHTANQVAAGLQSRDSAKTFIYAFLYGAGDGKIGEIVGGKAQDGKRLKAEFLDNTPALRALRREVDRGSTKGWVRGLDGRRLHIRSRHSALNVLLQSAGAIVMKQALVLLAEYAKGYKLDFKFVLNVHDEFQVEVTEDQADWFGGLAVDCIKRAGLDFNLNCPLDGEYKVGKTWAETH